MTFEQIKEFEEYKRNTEIWSSALQDQMKVLNANLYKLEEKSAELEMRINRLDYYEKENSNE